MNSKKTKALIETMHDEAIARCERTAERRTEAGDRRSEGGAVSLARACVEIVRTMTNPLEMELGARKIERLCQRELEAAASVPQRAALQKAAVAASELFDLIDTLSDEEAVKAIEVVKARAKVSMVTREARKAEGSSKVLKCGSSKVEGEVRHA